MQIESLGPEKAEPKPRPWPVERGRKCTRLEENKLETRTFLLSLEVDSRYYSSCLLSNAVEIRKEGGFENVP